MNIVSPYTGITRVCVTRCGQWRSQKFLTWGASICSISSYPSLLSCCTKSALGPYQKRHDMNRLYRASVNGRTGVLYARKFGQNA